jgi:hypothetical protein
VNLSHQRKSLEQRVSSDRRAKGTEFIRSILDARSGTDRRAIEQVYNDNIRVNKWLETYHAKNA